MSLGAGVNGIDVVDNIVYLACGSLGLQIVDITNISEPILLG